MAVRRLVWRVVATVLLTATAFASVGLTAPADSLFTITIHPALINLSVDVDIKLGAHHLHKRWSALPEGIRI